MLSPVEVGGDKIVVSHLQYADDTIFVVEGSLTNAVAIKRILKIFELISGLQVNFDKCNVFGLNMEEDEVSEAASLFGCQVGDLPLPYLGMKVGGKARSVSVWADVVDKIKKRLGSWDAKKISLGGQITLVKSVLNAIPTFRLSFMPMPVGTANAITALQRNFLWGSGLNNGRKTAWIKWANLCSNLGKGGLGLKDLRSFNLALLGKWIWRYLQSNKGLWGRVVMSRHGNLKVNQSGLSLEGRRGGDRGWWGKLVELFNGSGGEWMWGSLRKVVGNGCDTRLWDDLWVGNETLKNRFPRLYHLSTDKDCVVGQAGRWEDERWVWRIGWRRNLRDRDTTMVGELLNLLNSVELRATVEDRWWWGSDSKGIYTVKRAYAEMRGAHEVCGSAPDCVGNFNLLWKTAALFKAQTMAWRLLWNKLPTRDNLAKRSLLPDNVRVCCVCNTADESAEHVFLMCPGAERIWARIVEWIGVRWSAPGRIPAHQLAFAHLLGDDRNSKVLGGLWVCVVWTI